MKLSEFTKSLHFGGNSKKTGKNSSMFSFSCLKTYFYRKNYLFFQLQIGMTLIDLNQTYPIEPSEFEISLSAKSHDRNTAENCQNIYDAEKRIVSKLKFPKSKVSESWLHISEFQIIFILKNLLLTLLIFR